MLFRKSELIVLFCNFQASFTLSVKFAHELGSSEGTVEFGGPTREFLRVVLPDNILSNAFAGPEIGKQLSSTKKVQYDM